LYAYRTAAYSSKGVLPFELMHGRCAHKLPLATRTAHDVISYQDQLRAKLVQLYDSVKLNNVQTSSQQKTILIVAPNQEHLLISDLLWLSIPAAGKLDPKWEGGWVIPSFTEPNHVHNK